MAGEIAQCDLWFPLIALPVGFGQVRRPEQLPVLTMICGYSRWLMPMLIPPRHAQDLFAGGGSSSPGWVQCRGRWSGTAEHYVRVDGNDYSVHPAAVGRRVLVRADLQRVQASCDGQRVADQERIWAKHHTLSDPVHIEVAKVLCRKHLSAARSAREPDVAICALTDYDQVFGVDFDGGVA